MVDPTVNLLSQLPPDRLQKLTRAERERLLAHLASLEQRRRRIPLATFEPTAKQRAFAESRARIRIFLGGNRSGKTWIGCAEALAHGLGYRPWLVPDLELVQTEDGLHFPPRDSIPRAAWVCRADGEPIAVPNQGMIISGQGLQRGIGPTIWPRLRAFWPTEVKLKSWHGLLGTPTRVQLDNGSVIFLASGDQDRMTFEGVRLDWAYADEPVPSYVFNGIWRGLTDSFGSVWFTQTPLGADSRWLYIGLIATPRTDVELFTAGIRDNPHLPASSVEAFENTSTWTEQERAARLFGRFEFLSDAVWPQFTRSHHVIEPRTFPAEWTRGMTLDPHLRRPWAMIWWVVDPVGRIFVCREWPTENFRALRSGSRAPSEYATLIRDIEGKERATIRLMDPNFGRQPTGSARVGIKTLQEELAEYDLHFSCKINDNLEFGIGAVADALRCDPAQPPVGDNEPLLRVFDTCANTIAALENFAYKAERGPEHPNTILAADFKDFADLIRYTVVAPRARSLEPWNYLSEEDLRAWMRD